MKILDVKINRENNLWIKIEVPVTDSNGKEYISQMELANVSLKNLLMQNIQVLPWKDGQTSWTLVLPDEE